MSPFCKMSCVIQRLKLAWGICSNVHVYPGSYEYMKSSSSSFFRLPCQMSRPIAWMKAAVACRPSRLQKSFSWTVVVVGQNVGCIHLFFTTWTLSRVSNTKGLVYVVGQSVMVCPQSKDDHLFSPSHHVVVV